MAAGNAVNRPNEAVYVSMALTRFVSSESSLRRRRANSCRPIWDVQVGHCAKALAARLENNATSGDSGASWWDRFGQKNKSSEPATPVD
jgi:hypothetical protein